MNTKHPSHQDSGYQAERRLWLKRGLGLGLFAATGYGLASLTVSRPLVAGEDGESLKSLVPRPSGASC
ncbi:MAG: hypothetical protein R3E95_10920 [Thiolinea sp.]